MKFITKNKSGKGYIELLKIHKKNGSYKKDVQDDKSKNITIKTDVLQNLLEEQGFICAYCMRKISIENATIEHIIGKSYIDEKGIKVGEKEDTNYDNLLAVCKGNFCQNNLHCDKSRANYQNKRPFLFISPLKEQQMKNIKFSQSGVIYYKEPSNKIDTQNEALEDKEIRYDLNKVLNLNCENLIEDREKILTIVKKSLIRYNFDKKFILKELDYWQQNNQYKEFCQVAISELEKYI